MTYQATDNRLGTVTLPSGETITYQYNSSGQVTQQTSSSSGTTSFTYTAEGAIQTMTDSTGTTTYHYDPVTNNLSGIDYPSGSSIAYTYDLLGRVKTVTEKGSPTATAYVTTYNYDAFGNLKSVLDPAGGTTTMLYDQANRLLERDLPNEVKTVYSYDDLDQVTFIVYKNTAGTVLASVTYERDLSGNPTKITRENGDYEKLEYDSALRVTKESYYNIADTLLNETIYTYDASGKRTAQSTSTGNSTYNYTSGYQLDNIQSLNGTENYKYDVNGRLTMISRDGTTLDLKHDTSDRLTQAKNETTGGETDYIYDGSGNRVDQKQGSQERKFLVAPTMGSELESTNLVTDASGNLISNYIYAGGSSPFMRIGADGKPVYYLTDAMGSVIGLADTTGQSTGSFVYDSFGNIKTSSGSAANTDATGGDFRFQGQWLDANTGLYNFRARDYDPHTGTFLSRDPVDPIQTQPESFNPYQFAYNNPQVYSDPSGMISINELNAEQVISDILDTIETETKNTFRQEVSDQIKGISTDVLKSLIQTIVPFDFSPFSTDIGEKGIQLDNLFRNTVCNVIGGTHNSFLNKLWLEVGIDQSGNPKEQGYGCGLTPPYHPVSIPISFNYSHPDFIFKDGEPVTTDKNPKAYLIGDLKFSIDSIKVQSDQQFKSILSYAKLNNIGTINKNSGGHQYVPVAIYLSAKAGKNKGKTSIEEKMKRWAIEKYGVVFDVISLF